MKIQITQSHSFTTICVTDQNVNIEYDATDSIQKENNIGQPYYDRDVSNEAMDMFSHCLEDLAYYREREYDSTSLMSLLMKKLPEEKQQLLLKEFIKDYQED